MSFKLDGTKFKAFADDGTTLVGGLLYTYVSGTTTNKATYTTSALNVANANPIPLDARGEADVWLSVGAYTFVLKTAAGVTIDTVDGVVTSDLTESTGADKVGTASGGTVQDFIDAPVAASFQVNNCHTVSAASPGNSSSAVLVRSLAAGRRGEVQVSPNDGLLGTTFDVAGGEYTLYGWDYSGPSGSANNTALTIRATRNVDGSTKSWDVCTFKTGSRTDAPLRTLNDAFGYTTEVSATDGKHRSSRGYRAGDGIGGFSPPNNTPNFAAASTLPSYDWEERSSDGTTLLYQWRARLVGGVWAVANVTSGVVGFQLSDLGRPSLPNADTKITTGGAFTPNTYIDPADGQVYRTGWTKPTLPANATDLATAQTLVNAIKSALISYGITL